jgi:gliding motility-associated-like protein
VDSIPDASITPAGPFCKDILSEQLTPLYNGGGSFSSDVFVDATGLFEPVKAYVGLNRVYYSFTDSRGCSSIDSIDVQVDSIPDASMAPAGPFCANDAATTISLVHNSGGTFEVTAYNDANGLFDPSLAAIGSNDVFYTFTDSRGCVGRDTMAVVVDTIPDASITPAGPFCSNLPGQQLIGLVNTNGTYDAPNVMNDGSFIPMDLGVGNHWVYYTVVDSKGCENRDSTEVVIWDIPDATINQAGPFCANDAPQQITTQNTGGTFGVTTYLDNSGMFSLEVAQAGMHEVTYLLVDVNGCEDHDTIDVEVYAIPTNTLTIDPAEGCEPFEVTFTTENETVIEWTIDGVTYSDASVTQTFNAGTYPVALTVTNADGCSISLDDELVVHENPIAGFGVSPDKIYINDPRVFFDDSSVVDISQWTWDFGDGGSDFSQNPMHRYADPGTYTVQLAIADVNGCVDTTTGTVTILDELLFFIPNAFSPNLDGDNDVFRVYGLGIDRIECSIFNRWGEKLLESENFTDWDGTYKGSTVSNGVYVYIITIIDNRGMKHYAKGEVHLVR